MYPLCIYISGFPFWMDCHNHVPYGTYVLAFSWHNLLFWVSFPYQVSVYPNPFLMTKRRNPWGRPSKIHVEFPNFSSRTTRLSAWLFILSSSYCFIRLTIILPTTTRSQIQLDLNLVGGLEPWIFFDFPFSWEYHHPNWLTHIFQRGRYTTHQIIINHH